MQGTFERLKRFAHCDRRQPTGQGKAGTPGVVARVVGDKFAKLGTLIKLKPKPPEQWHQ